MKSKTAAAREVLSAKSPSPVVIKQAMATGVARARLLRIDRYVTPKDTATLADDVRAGLTSQPKVLPPKYFYDDRGSWLFDAICDLPEYYLTRTERALLETVAPEIIRLTRPTHIVELGSGASRKTRLLLDQFTRLRPAGTYVPFDVSENMLRRSAAALRRRYPRLRIHGIVGDYERHLKHMPVGRRRLVIFLGSTLGNFAPAAATGFLRGLGQQLHPGDAILLGLDLVKPIEILHAAYNDSQGLTADFNRNVLRVINRELGADFDLERFSHVAFYNPAAAQIEMHLRAVSAHRVQIPSVNLDVALDAGETIQTEISRKFTRNDATALLAAAGCRLRRWYVSADGYFALTLGART